MTLSEAQTRFANAVRVQQQRERGLAEAVRAMREASEANALASARVDEARVALEEVRRREGVS
jgi:hypothetical protein